MRVILPNDCTGMVLDFRGTNCSELIGVLMKYQYIWNAVRDSKYFLSGSSITVNYNETERGMGSHVILKSYAAFLEYKKLSISMDSVCDNSKSLPYLLSENATSDPIFRNNIWKFVDNVSTVFHIEEPDFYYVILNYTATRPPVTIIVEYSYNLSALKSYENRRDYSIAPGPLGNYALLPIADLFSTTRPVSCKLLRSNCQFPSSDVPVNKVNCLPPEPVNEVSYVFERRVDVFGIPSVLVFACLLVVMVSVIVHVCCIRRRKDQVFVDQEMT